MKVDALLIGAGPAGLTAADEFLRNGHVPVVIEAAEVCGGIARTVEWRGHRVDIGGHRFFTKVPEVQARWDEWMGTDMLEVPRLSRIFYQGKFYSYPLKPLETLRNFGLCKSLGAVLSYVHARLKPVRPENSFADWVRNRFGRQLYETFFKSYTEKVWGIPCTEIRADWAAQRISGLSLSSAILNSLRLGGGVKSLIKTFRYPRLGPGMMWERVARLVESRGGAVWRQARAVELHHAGGRIQRVRVERAEGPPVTVEPDFVVSTLPVGALIAALRPAVPAAVKTAADALRHRDFLIVTLVVRTTESLFPDNWIYIHDPQFRVGRIQNFRNWSADLVAEPGVTTLGLEYFCSRGDDLWSREDEALIQLATQELAALGLAGNAPVETGFVIRQCNAYPVYDETYASNLAVVRDHLALYTNLATAGRSGLHRYNNQDHSMLSALVAVRQLLGQTRESPWAVNTERSSHEEQVLPARRNR